MAKMFSCVSGLLARLSLLAIVAAVVIVPVVARSRDQIEHRDATRLSIKHSWLGVAPPSKASVAPQPMVALAAVVARPELLRVACRAFIAAVPAFRSVLVQPSDPLRGPPVLQLS
jgi:hypothetical protein